MELLVTTEDVKNELGIDLAQELGVQPRMANNYLFAKQEEVLTYIGNFAYYGAKQVQYYLTVARCVDVIRRAILMQVQVLAERRWVELDIDAPNAQQISPRVKRYLGASGLLFTGRVPCYENS